MELKIHTIGKRNFAELVSDKQEINKLQDAIDILGNAFYLGAETIIIKKENLHPDFFELKTKFAGDILQKFSNYRLNLVIIGDFKNNKSKSLNDFILESNKTGHIMFVSSLEEV